MWSLSFFVSTLIVGGTTLIFTTWLKPLDLLKKSHLHGNLLTGENQTVSSSSCELKSPEPSDVDLTQTYAASYPGSGAQMSRLLIESLTGITTASPRKLRKLTDQRRVTVKTHFPAMRYNNWTVPFDGEINRGILLLRNPMKALPSWHNFQYERERGLPNHSTRAPLEEWVRWRDENIAAELTNWKEFVTYWMDRIDPDDRLVLSYEDFTDDAKGPPVTARLAKYLSEVDGVDIEESVKEGDAACVWRKVVHYEDYNSVKLRTSSHRSGPAEKPFTTDQLTALGTMLQDLVHKYESDKALVDILRVYIEKASAELGR